MRNLHKFTLENYRIGSLRLIRDWEKFQLRQCNYKNHRIFTLRCIHREIVPVSIKLKSTLKSERAKKILRTAEKKLLHTRLKSINSLLGNNAKQLELTRSKVVSILTAPNYPQCQEFIEKIKEKRFNKVKERQVRKINNLINKKEGGITWQSSKVFPAARAFPQVNNRQAAKNSQAVRLTPRASLKPLRMIVLFPRAISSRQATHKVSWQTALFHWQRVLSPRQAVPSPLRQAVPSSPQERVLFLRECVPGRQFPSFPGRWHSLTGRE